MYLVVTSVTWYVTLIAIGFWIRSAPERNPIATLPTSARCLPLASKNQCSAFQFLFPAQDSVRLAIFRPGTREETFTSLAAAVHFTSPLLLPGRQIRLRTVQRLV